MYNMQGGALSRKTISKMERGGASQADIDFARDTQYSMDANHVVRHREYIKTYNPSDTFREPNNFVLHPNTYQFGPGRRSPQFIGHQFSTLPGPVYMSGPPIMFAPNVQQFIGPYVVFQ